MKLFELPPISMLQAVAYFAKTGSVTQTAAAMGTTFPHIMQYFSGVEAHLGTAIFDRSEKEIKFNSRGKTLAEDLVAGFSMMSTGVQKAKGIKQPATISIATPPTLALNFFMDLLPKFRQKFPDFKVTLFPMTDGDIDAIHDADLVIKSIPVGQKAKQSQYLFTSALSLVAARGLVKGYVDKGMTHLPIVREMQETEANRVFEKSGFLDKHQGPVTEVSDFEFIPAILYGRGAGVVESYLLADQLSEGKLLRLKMLSEERDFIIKKTNEFSDLPVTAFVQWLTQELQAKVTT